MNEKELKKEINVGIDYANPNRVWKAIGDLEDLSFQKGKLEERERILKIVLRLKENNLNNPIYVPEFIEQLQKEIGEEKQNE